MRAARVEELVFKALTLLGDAGFVLPASALLFALLWAAGGRRPALAFAAAATLCVAATLTAKIAFMACGAPFGLALRSPSGHASLAVMFFSSSALLAAAAAPGRPGRVLAALCLVLAGLIASSRVALDAHSVEETLLGAAIGAACFLPFWPLAPSRLAFDRRAFAAVLALFAALYALFGRPLYVENRIEDLAERLQTLLGC